MLCIELRDDREDEEVRTLAEDMEAEMPVEEPADEPVMEFLACMSMADDECCVGDGL